MRRCAGDARCPHNSLGVELMILQGNQRGGAKDLALHLLKEENDHVTVHDMRGFVSDDLVGALNEVYAVSRGTKAKQFLFSLSLNPPPEEKVSTETFEKAIVRTEKEFGLSAQPRAVVFHEKEGRRHAHAVWSRIDTEKMKAIPLSKTKLRLQEISKEIYIQQDWNMPQGFIKKQERNQMNFTLEQWQQAKRQGKDPRKIKSDLQASWALSDTQQAFKQALQERGYKLAKGDRRGFVAMDFTCEVYSLSKWLGVKTKDVKGKLGCPDKLQSVDETRKEFAMETGRKITALRQKLDAEHKARMAESRKKKQTLIQKQRQERQKLIADHQSRMVDETKIRQARFNKGLRGLFDRITGQRKKTIEQNRQEMEAAVKRDQREKDQLIFRQLQQRKSLQSRSAQFKAQYQEKQQSLSKDQAQYQQLRVGSKKVANFKDKLTPQNRERSLILER